MEFDIVVLSYPGCGSSVGEVELVQGLNRENWADCGCLRWECDPVCNFLSVWGEKCLKKQ